MLTFLLCACTIVRSQPWEHYYPMSQYRYATSICQTYDKGYLIAVLDGTAFHQVIIHKLDIDGNFLWSKTIHSTGSNSVRAFDICTSNDNGFLICGVSYHYDPDGAAFVMKFDECGERVWTKEFGLTNDYDANFYIIPTSDGNYLIGANELGPSIAGAERVSLIKIDKDGSTLWSGNYSHFDGPHIAGVYELDSSQYYITAVTYAPDSGQSAPSLIRSQLIKVDSGGNEIWSRVYGVNDSTYSIGNSVIQWNDSLLLYLTTFKDHISNLKYWNYLIKMDVMGNVIWKKFVSSTNDLSEAPNEIIRMSDSTAVIICSVSYSYNFNTIDDYRLKAIKINANGDVLDSIQFANGNNLAFKSFKNKDGDIVICGLHTSGTQMGPFAIKINSDLQVDTLLNMNFNYDSLCTSSISGGISMYDTTTVTGLKTVESSNLEFTLYPVPAKDFFLIQLNKFFGSKLNINIIDITGKLIYDDVAVFFTKEIEIPTTNISSGFYLVRIVAGDNVLTRKLIIQK